MSTLLKPAYHLDTEALVADINNVLSMLEKHASDTKGELAKEIEAIRTAVELLSTEVKDDTTRDMGTIKGNVETRLNQAIYQVFQQMKVLIAEHKVGMDYLYDRVNRLEDGQPGAPGKDADEEAMMSKMMSNITPMMDQKFQTLQDEIKKLRDEVAQKRVLGTMGNRALGPSVIVKSLYNQSFPETPNGVRTTFTLIKAPRTTGAERIYQNRTRCHLGASNDYTVSGRTVTFNVAPATGDVLAYDIEY